MSTVQLLPIITIQPDFLLAIEEVSEGIADTEKFWVSCYKSGSPSVHENVVASLDEKDRSKVLLSPKNASVTIDREDVSFFIIITISLA